MFNQMKQMYELQKRAKEIQSKLESIVIDQTEGGIKIRINGIFKVESLEIDSTYFSPDKKEKLESLLCKVFSDAVQEVQKRSALQSQDLLKGLSL